MSKARNTHRKSNRNIALILMAVVIALCAMTLASARLETFAEPSLIKSVGVYAIDGEYGVVNGISGTHNVVVQLRQAQTKKEDLRFDLTQMDSCQTLDASTSECRLTTTIFRGEGESNVYVTYQSNTQQSYQPVQFYVDASQPAITNAHIQDATQSTATIEITAADPRRLGQCGGLHIVEAATSVDFTNAQAFELSGCLNTSTFNITRPAQSGNHTLYLRVVDRALISSPVTTIPFAVDNDPLVISTAGFGKNDELLNAVSTQSSDLQLILDLQDQFGIKNITATQTDLFLNKEQATKCLTLNDQITRCIWDIGTLDANVQSYNITFNATDDIHPKMLQYPVTPLLDSQAPSIRDRQIDEYGYFGGKGTINNLTLEIVDAGAGVDFDNIRADFSTMSTDIGVLLGVCNATLSTCTWEVNLPFTVSSDTYPVQIYVKDVLGFSDTITIDVPVQVKDMTITNVNYNTRSPSASSQVPYEIYISGNSALPVASLSYDVSSITTSDLGTTTSCDGNTTCTLTIPASNLRTTGTTGTIELELFDQAGNSATYSTNISLFDAEPGTAPHVVHAFVGDISQGIDRRIATESPMQVQVPIIFSMEEDVFIQDKRISCDGLEAFLFDDTTQNPYFIGSSSDTSLLVFEFLLDDVTSKVNSIPLNCTIDLFVGQGDRVYQTPQRINLTDEDGNIATVPLENLPYGTIDKVTLERLHDMKKDLDEGIGKFIGQADDVVTAVKQTCDVMQTIDKVYTVIEGLKPVVYVMAQALESVGAGTPVWNSYLWLECNLKSLKEILWPSDSNFAMTQDAIDKEDGVGLSPMWGGTYTGDLEGWEYTGGILKQMCSFIYCRQCNEGFSLTSFADDALLDVLSEGLGTAAADNPGRPYDANNPETKVQTESLDAAAKINLEGRYDPYDSWAVSATCLCLPGLIHNLEKARQLQCKRASCIRQQAETGQSQTYCHQEYKENMCVFFYGGLTQIIPGYQLVKDIVESAVDAIRNLPGRALAASRDLICLPVEQDGGFFQQETDNARKAAGGQTHYCSYEKLKKQQLSNVAYNTEAIACGLMDATFLTASIDTMFETTFGSIIDVVEGGPEETDYCELAFADLPDVPKEIATPEDEDEDEDRGPLAT